MDAQEILRRVRSIEIRAKGLTQNIFAGEYHTAFKGRGMAFAEVREYSYGDDVRNIDWNVTARHGKPYIKVFEEERELTVMLLLDVSGSTVTGKTQNTKRETEINIAATLAYSAMKNHDKIGLLLFSDRIERFIPPRSGQKHIMRIIREMINPDGFQGKKTDIGNAMKFLTGAVKKRCTAFVISDFGVSVGQFKASLEILSKKHDTVAVRVYDPREAELPPVGMLKVQDAESGELTWVDTGSEKVRGLYKASWLDKSRILEDLMGKVGIDYISMSADEDYVVKLRTLFQKRAYLRE